MKTKLSEVLKRIRPYLIAGVCLLVLLLAIEKIVIGDPEGAKNFLESNAKVVVKTGEIKDVTLRKYWKFPAEADSAAYNDYLFHVKGERGTFLITVRRIESRSDDEAAEYILQSIETR